MKSAHKIDLIVQIIGGSASINESKCFIPFNINLYIVLTYDLKSNDTRLLVLKNETMKFKSQFIEFQIPI